MIDKPQPPEAEATLPLFRYSIRHYGIWRIERRLWSPNPGAWYWHEIGTVWSGEMAKKIVELLEADAQKAIGGRYLPARHPKRLNAEGGAGGDNQ